VSSCSTICMLTRSFAAVVNEGDDVIDVKSECGLVTTQRAPKQQVQEDISIVGT
jgi:hypothetical protein